MTKTQEIELKPITSEARALVALENLADMPKGGTADGHFTVVRDASGVPLYVRRTYKGSWVLWERPNSERARWCDTKVELLEDLNHFMLTGHLPQAKARW